MRPTQSFFYKNENKKKVNFTVPEIEKSKNPDSFSPTLSKVPMSGFCWGRGGGPCEVGNRKARADCVDKLYYLGVWAYIYGGSLGQRSACTNNA